MCNMVNLKYLFKLCLIFCAFSLVFSEEDNDQLTESTEDVATPVEDDLNQSQDEIESIENEALGSDDTSKAKENEEKKKEKIEYAPIIETREGLVRGKVMTTRKGRKIYAYLGIPYGKPPKGELRFKPPQRVDPWEGVKDVLKEGNHCPQITFPERKFDGDEDCLYVNVFITRDPPKNVKNTTGLHDTIIFIHGGGFSHGSGDIVDYSPENLLDHDLVLVTFNYRLGPLGFISTYDEELEGNYGLKDQTEILRWTMRNSPAFGGNPHSVTLLGHHAGGTSAHLHLLGLIPPRMFHGIVALSGTALSPWAFIEPEIAKERAFKLGKLVGCKKEALKNSKKLAACLRKTDVQELYQESKKILEFTTDVNYPFVPTVEPQIPNRKLVVYNYPEKMIANLKYKKYVEPMILGVVKNDGLPQALQLMVFGGIMDKLNQNPGKYVPKYLKMYLNDENLAFEVGEKIWEFYMEDDILNYGTIVHVADMTTDYHYFYPMRRVIQLHKNATDAPIFAYRFSFNRRDTFMALGVPQGDDVQLLLPDTIGDKKLELSKKAFNVSEKMVKLMVNYAQDGDPTPEEYPELDNVLWPDAIGPDFEFLDISKKLSVITEGFHKKRMEFWDSIYETIDAHKQEEKSPEKDEL